MFDIGMTELLVIGIVALIVVGPKDLPGMFRTLGRFTGKVKGMAREFQRAMDDAADEAGVKDIGRDLKGLSNPKKFGFEKLKEATDGLDDVMSDKPKPPKGGAATQALRETREAESAATRTAAADRLKVQDAPAKTTGTAADTALSASDTKGPEA